MSGGTRIMIATNVVADGTLLTEILGEEYDDILVSINADEAVADFERFKPHVLLLAFGSLEKIERYYLGLYRLGTLVHDLPHRALILCREKNVNDAYEMCRKGHFDDYILFWPLAPDTRRLLMAVKQARCGMEQHAIGPEVAELAVHTNRIAELETILAHSLAQGGEHLTRAGRSLETAEAEIGAALDDFSSNVLNGGMDGALDIHDAARVRGEFERLKAEGVMRRIFAVKEALAPARGWVAGLAKDVAPQIESARAMAAIVKNLRPVVLVVDDDSFQCKILSEILRANSFEPIFANSGSKALAVMENRRPDLVLMDFMMPDLDGVEATRRMKAMPLLADIPVIMITGHSEKMIIVKSLQAGAVDFVVKPIDREILIKKIRATIDLAHAQALAR